MRRKQAGKQSKWEIFWRDLGSFYESILFIPTHHHRLLSYFNFGNGPVSLLSQHTVCVVSVPGGYPAIRQRAAPCSSCPVGGSREHWSQTALFESYTRIKLHQYWFFFMDLDEDCYCHFCGQNPQRLPDMDRVEGNVSFSLLMLVLWRVMVCHHRTWEAQLRSSVPPAKDISEIYYERQYEMYYFVINQIYIPLQDGGLYWDQRVTKTWRIFPILVISLWFKTERNK